MKTKDFFRIYLLALMGLACPNFSFAEDAPAPTVLSATAGAPVEPVRGLDRWGYIYNEIGISHNFFPQSFQNSVNEEGGGTNLFSPNIGVLGAYYSFKKANTLVGFVLGEGEGASYFMKPNVEFFVYEDVAPSLSVMHFFGSGIGDGPFVRADIGSAQLSVSGSYVPDTTLASGTAFLIGGGYAFPFFHLFSLLLNLDYSAMDFSGQDFGAVKFDLGLMF